jgi:DNA-binding NtrC family response regulator
MANKERAKLDRLPIHFLPTARRRLCTLEWLGNVRQLQNFVRRFGASSKESAIDKRMVEEALREDAATGISPGPRQIVASLRLDHGLGECLEEVERMLLKAAKEAAGSESKAAKLLKLNSQQSFHSRWSKHFGPKQAGK